MQTRSIRTTASVFAAALLAACFAIPAGAADFALDGLAEDDQAIEFETTKKDRAALRAKQKATRLEQKAAASRKRAEAIDARLGKLEDLIAATEEQLEAAQAALSDRLVERYEAGELAQEEFLLTSQSLGDALERMQILGASDASDAALADEYARLLARLEGLRTAAEAAGDGYVVAAANQESTAEVLEHELTVADEQHQEARTRRQKDADPVGGEWLAFDGAFGSFMPTFGSNAWQGARTAARPSSTEQIQRVLADMRLDIYAGGRGDIAAGRIDGRLLDALTLMADSFGSVTITSLISGHGVFTTSGNVSAHTYGCAADIGAVAGVRITPSTQGSGSITEQAVMLLAGLQGDLTPHQVISLMQLGGPTMALSDHGDHIHLGYSC